jgi:hypothetical protein
LEVGDLDLGEEQEVDLGWQLEGLPVIPWNDEPFFFEMPPSNVG